MAMLVDVSSVVASLSAQSVTRRRSAAPTIDSAGHVVAGATADATITGALQRPGQDALERLPEGMRSRARWLMHTTADIRGGTGTTEAGRSGAMPDVAIYGGVSYAVVDITDQSAHGQYRRVILLDGGS